MTGATLPHADPAYRMALLAVSTMLVLAGFAAPAHAQDHRGDDHRGYDWPPPVVYGEPDYPPPPAAYGYGPGMGA